MDFDPRDHDFRDKGRAGRPDPRDVFMRDLDLAPSDGRREAPLLPGSAPNRCELGGRNPVRVPGHKLAQDRSQGISPAPHGPVASTPFVDCAAGVGAALSMLISAGGDDLCADTRLSARWRSLPPWPWFRVLRARNRGVNDRLRRAVKRLVPAQGWFTPRFPLLAVLSRGRTVVWNSAASETRRRRSRA